DVGAEGPYMAGLPGHILLERHQEDRDGDEERRPDGGDGSEYHVSEGPGADGLEHVGQDRPDEAARHHRRGPWSAQAAPGGCRNRFGHRAPVPVRTIQMLFQRIWRSRAGDMCWM